MDLENIISREEIQNYHKDFKNVKSSKLRQGVVFTIMHMNRIFQSSLIVLQNPPIWVNIIKSFIKAVLGKKSLLRSLEIAVTYRCNSSCQQCSCRLHFDKELEKTSRLTLDEFKNAIDQAVGLGAFQFTINGGEPMLEEKTVFSLIEYIKGHQGRYVHLCTNGTLLDDKKIQMLVDSGLDSIEIGFDSAFEIIHDTNRIKGSFKKILESIEICKKNNLKVVLNTILTNEKVLSDDIIYTFRLAKHLGCFLQITPCCLTGALKNRLDLMLTDEAKLYFHWLLSKSWNNRSDLYSSLTNIKCPAAREKIGLQPYGDVVSCPLIQIRYGNIREKSLKDIQQEMLRNPYYLLKKDQGCLPAMSEEFIKGYLLDK